MNEKNLMRRAMRKAGLLLLNNIPVNQLLIKLGMDELTKSFTQRWESRSYDPAKDEAENVGYSRHPEILESMDKVKGHLKNITRQYLKPGDKVLEIGCGTGVFLETFSGELELHGIDLNPTFLHRAKQRIPQGHFSAGNYLNMEVPQRYAFIYLIGVLQYIVPSRLRELTEKISRNLNPGGLLLIHYSHALSGRDLWYPDLRYIRYSPAHLESLVTKDFAILYHQHLMDERIVDRYDEKHYFFPDGSSSRLDTNWNTCVLIAQKKS